VPRVKAAANAAADRKRERIALSQSLLAPIILPTPSADKGL
jgi:hypothetical protein